MSWSMRPIPEAQRDMRRLDGSVAPIVRKAMAKIRKNPLPTNEGGLGKPLGNHAGSKLSGLLKVKLKAQGIRIVYRADKERLVVLVVVVGDRADEEVYRIAAQRVAKYPELI